MKIKIMLPGNYLQHNVVCIQDEIFHHSFVLNDSMSLQATCQIFVSPLVRLGETISHSDSDNIHMHLIYPTHNASLLSRIFTAAQFLYIIVSYDHSDFVIEVNEFERSKLRESRNVNISICSVKIKIRLTENYLEYEIVCMENQIFYHSFILKDYISLQATCQIFVSPFVRLRQSISHSQWSLVHSHLIYPTHNASLLSMIFTSVRLLYMIMNYDDSNFVTELNEFDHSKIRESRNVNISICSMKIKFMLPGNYLQREIVCISNQIFYHSFILKDYISLQTASNICRSARAVSTANFSFP
jgi:hypothetical protein